jgi:hypothetical protein
VKRITFIMVHPLLMESRMSKDLFTINHKDHIYKCYLDEEGELWVIDDQGNTTIIATFRRSPALSDAREAVKGLLQTLGW